MAPGWTQPILKRIPLKMDAFWPKLTAGSGSPYFGRNRRPSHVTQYRCPKKDFWVCWTLNTSLPLKASLSFDLKGGPSLSKIIQSDPTVFSGKTSIFLVDRAALGFTGERDLAGRPHSPATKRQKELDSSVRLDRN